MDAARAVIGILFDQLVSNERSIKSLTSKVAETAKRLSVVDGGSAGGKKMPAVVCRIRVHSRKFHGGYGSISSISCRS